MVTTTELTTGRQQGAISEANPHPVHLSGLDGIRGLAALFVVLHHCWLMSFPGFPVDNGPGWAGWLLYGHFAVVVFIVLSGFSLGVGPARSGWRLDSFRGYAHRRAWRILPPYWPALIFSLIVAWTIVRQPDQVAPTGKSVLIYGLLLQDVFGAPTPNGAFWSIAIEAQLYFLLPIGLLILRRLGATALITAVLMPVLLIGVFSPYVPAVHSLTRFTPQFAVGFALGMVAASVVGNDRYSRYPWHWLALGALVPAVTMILVKGSVWNVSHYLWVDLALTPAIVLLLAAIATGSPRALVRFLDIRPIRSLGGFSYSLYLVHAPIIVAVALLIVSPHVNPGVPAFLATLGIGVPLALGIARLFAGVFELPFRRHKSWPTLRAALLTRIRLRRTKSQLRSDLR
jgi:peptidoglycan/LPS O-acetylase OafA/YrhL